MKNSFRVRLIILQLRDIRIETTCRRATAARNFNNSTQLHENTGAPNRGRVIKFAAIRGDVDAIYTGVSI